MIGNGSVRNVFIYKQKFTAMARVKKEDIEKILDWESSSVKQVEIPFKPARVLLQDFIGVPVVVDLACMRDAMKELGSDSNKINPLVPVDLVIDHSVQVDVKGQRMQCRPI
ncbi:hypothetical protein K1719_037873 [Acacia pycnantha]|nr:hypothetical protein K1719_037873 [Acacia pycnantha]